MQQYETYLPPGVIRCNSTMPCKGFLFDNVNAHGWWRLFRLNYIVENVEGEVHESKPVPAFSNLEPADDFAWSEEDVYAIIGKMIEQAITGQTTIGTQVSASIVKVLQETYLAIKA